MDTSQLLLWGGAAVMAASVLAGLAAAVILRLTGKAAAQAPGRGILESGAIEPVRRSHVSNHRINL